MSDRDFSFTFNVKTCWRPFLGLFAALLASLIVFEIVAMRFIRKPTVQDQVFSTVLIILAVFLFFFFYGILFAYAYAKILPTISYKGHNFVFKGEMPTLAGMVLKGSALSVCSLGLYVPRYLKVLIEYLARKSEYGNVRFAFGGSAEKLFKKFLLGITLPTAVAITVALVVPAPQPTDIIIHAILCGILLIGYSPFFGCFIAWFGDFRWGGNRIVTQVEAKKAASKIARQTALAVCSFGLLLPLAVLNIWKYIAGQTYYIVEKKPKQHLCFGGKPHSGFFFIWGQMLLAIITFGIYTPWAYAAILRFFVENTRIEDC